MSPIRRISPIVHCCVTLSVLLLAAVSAAALDLDSLTPIFHAGAGAEQSGAVLLNPGECPEAELNKTHCLDLAPDTDPYKLNSYQFRITDPRWFEKGGRTLVVTFVDEGAGIIQPQALAGDTFNGSYAGPSRMRSYTRLNTGGLRRAVFEFNLSAPPPRDAKHALLTIGGLRHLVDLRIGPALSPAEWDEVIKTIPAKVTPMVTLTHPMQLTTTAGVSVFEKDGDDLAQSLEAMADLAPLARVLGFTSIESYVLWRRIEPKEEGKFDFSFYDGVIEKLKAYDLKWFPLLIVGSAYALPDWFAASPENVGMVCLEHGQSNAIQSIWSPWHQRHVSRVLRAFGEHYDGKGILEAVRLGPSGNFGESQYPAGGNWGLLLQRSFNFALYSLAFNDYRDPSEQQLLINLAQSVFDPSDPINVAPHMLHDRFTGVPEKNLLFQEAVNDAQVNNLATESVMRTMGITLMVPTPRTPYGFTTAMAPRPSAYTIWDEHPTPAPPGTNQPAMNNSTHGSLRTQPMLRAQIAAFLTPTGQVTQTCDGACDPE